MKTQYPYAEIKYTLFHDKTNIPKALTINGEKYLIRKEESGSGSVDAFRDHNGNAIKEKRESLALSLYKIATQKEKDVMTLGERHCVLKNSKQPISLARSSKTVTVGTADGSVKFHQFKSIMNTTGITKQTNTVFTQGARNQLTLNRNESQVSLDTQCNISDDISFGLTPNSCQNLRQNNNTINLLSNFPLVICNEDVSTENSVTCKNNIPQSLSKKSMEFSRQGNSFAMKRLRK